MKRLFKSAMLVAAAAAFAAGCSKDIAEDVSGNIPEVKKITVSATAYTPAEDGSSRTEIGPSTNDGKSYPLNWSTNATEQIFVGEVLDNATSNIHYRRSDTPDCTVTLTVENAKTATATVSKTAESSGGSYHAVYPASAVSDLIYDDAMGKVIYIDFPRNQTMPAKDQVDPAGTILYAKYEDADGTATNIEFDFNHLAAYGKMTVKNFKVENAADGEMIKEVRLIAKNEVDDEIPHKLSGQFFYYFDGASQPSDSEYLDYPTQYSDVVVNVEALNLKASDAGEFVVWFTTLPDKDIKDFALRITTTGGRTFRRGVAIPDGKNLLTFNAGKIKAFSVDMATAEEYGAGSGEVYELVTTPSQVTTPNDYVFLVLRNGNYYTLSNATAAAGKVDATDVSTTDFTVNDDNTLSGDVTGYDWTLTSLNGAINISSKENSASNLYCTRTNNGVTVGISSSGAWTFYQGSTANALTMSMPYTSNGSTETRYLSLYAPNTGTWNWRGYTSPYLDSNTNGTSQIYVYKKKIIASGPVILADDINTLSPNGNGNGTFSYDISGFSDNDVKVEITDYDGNISYAIIYEDTKEVYYILEPNYSTDEVISEIGLTATADNGESAVLRVKIKQSAAKPLTVTPSEIVVYGNTKQTITVSSPEYDINVKAYSDDTPGSVTVNKDSFEAGNSIEIELNIELEPDNDDVVGYVAIWRKGDSERNAVKVAVLTGEGEIDAPELREVSVTPSRLTATWTECTLADGYEWAVVAKNGNPDNDAIESGKVEGNNASGGIITLTAAITKLSAGEEYDFYVRAIQAGGLSSWSDAKTFSISADPYDGKKFVIVTNYTGTSSYVNKGYHAVSSQLVNNRLSRVALDWSSVPEIYNPTTSDIVWTVTKSQNSGYYYFANAEGQYLAPSSNNQAAFKSTGTDFEIKKSDTGDNTVTLHSGSYHLWLNTSYNNGVFGLSSTAGNITDVYLVPVGEVVEPGPGTDPGTKEPIEITINFRNETPSGWPTGNTTTGKTVTAGTYKYNSYDFILTDKTYCWVTNAGARYGFIITASNSLGLPVIEGYKLTTVEGTASDYGGKKSVVRVCAGATGSNIVSGGEAQTWNDYKTFTYNLTNTSINTQYYIYTDATQYTVISNLYLKYEAE